VAVESPEDRLGFFEPGDFGSEVVLTPPSGGGAAREIVAIYATRGTDLGVGLDAEVSSHAPELVGRAEDLQGVTAAWTVEVAGVGTFRAAERPERDGTGMARLRLFRGGP